MSRSCASIRAPGAPATAPSSRSWSRTAARRRRLDRPRPRRARRPPPPGAGGSRGGRSRPGRRRLARAVRGPARRPAPRPWPPGRGGLWVAGWVVAANGPSCTTMTGPTATVRPACRSSSSRCAPRRRPARPAGAAARGQPGRPGRGDRGHLRGPLWGLGPWNLLFGVRPGRDRRPRHRRAWRAAWSVGPPLLPSSARPLGGAAIVA